MSDGISYQGTSVFTFNTTSADDNTSKFQKTWAPSRQVLQQLSEDNDNQSTDNHARGLRTVLKREGPILAAVFNMYAPITQLERPIDDTHSSFVRCYDGLVSSAMSQSPFGENLRCIGQHLAFNMETRLPPDDGFTRSFSIKTNDSMEVDVNVYLADVGIYVSKEDFESSKCSVKTEKCTWQDLFRLRFHLRRSLRRIF